MLGAPPSVGADQRGTGGKCVRELGLSRTGTGTDWHDARVYPDVAYRGAFCPCRARLAWRHKTGRACADRPKEARQDSLKVS